MHQSERLIQHEQPRVMQRCAQLVSASLVGMQIALSGIFACFFSPLFKEQQQNAITELGARLLLHSLLDTFVLTVAFAAAAAAFGWHANENTVPKINSYFVQIFLLPPLLADAAVTLRCRIQQSSFAK